MEAWPANLAPYHITIKELLHIVLAVEVWGKGMQNRCVRFHCDNLAVVTIINKMTSKDSTIMKLVRRFVLSTLQLNIIFFAEHIPGKAMSWLTICSTDA